MKTILNFTFYLDKYADILKTKYLHVLVVLVISPLWSLSLEMLSTHCIFIMNVHFHNDASFCAEKKKKKKRNQTVPKDDDNDGIEGDQSTKLSLKTTPTAEGLYNYQVPVP